MTGSTEERNKAIVRDAFEALFNRRDFAVAEVFFSPNYIQHSAHIPPGRKGLFELIKSLPSTHQREMGAMVAEGDLVMAHGRLWGYGDGRPNRIVVDIVRIAEGLLAEHWDVIEDEASRAASRSGLPSFGDSFYEDRHDAIGA
ncbi:MAG TPA: nuclear transport factor 2 family protein [Solirubrobacteraceae bacterium]|jgi:predicted SnoaL-like aldol condensation-catalyzing enzyme|nr:nuclear transport factor 2 family protein [Solirubrobacteraceae bacterium]